MLISQQVTTNQQRDAKSSSLFNADISDIIMTLITAATHPDHTRDPGHYRLMELCPLYKLELVLSMSSAFATSTFSPSYCVMGYTIHQKDPLLLPEAVRHCQRTSSVMMFYVALFPEAGRGGTGMARPLSMYCQIRYACFPTGEHS